MRRPVPGLGGRDGMVAGGGPDILPMCFEKDDGYRGERRNTHPGVRSPSWGVGIWTWFAMFLECNLPRERCMSGWQSRLGVISVEALQRFRKP